MNFDLFTVFGEILGLQAVRLKRKIAVTIIQFRLEKCFL